MHEESQRQKKFAGLIQADLADILQRAAIGGGLTGLIISVSQVRVSVDLSIAKVYLSIFPNHKADELLEGIRSNEARIKHELAQRTRHQMRKVPNLVFYKDDSIEYIEGIEKSLKREEDPVKDPDLLEKRKKK